MSNYKELCDIRDAWNAGAYHVQMDIPSKVREGHIFDEDLSVKRNREMVEEYNANVERLQKEKTQRQSQLYREFTDDVVGYLMNTYDLNRRQAERVQSYVYIEKHSYMGDYFSALDEIASMVSDVLVAK